MKIDGSRKQLVIFSIILIVLAVLPFAFYWIGYVMPCETPADYTMQQSSFYTCYQRNGMLWFAATAFLGWFIVGPVFLLSLIINRTIAIKSYLKRKK